MSPRAPGRFSEEEWLGRGRALPRVVEALIELLERVDLEKGASESGDRVAYALARLGDKRRRGVEALVRALGSKDVNLRENAAAALGWLGDASVVPALEKIMVVEDEAINVRGNACVSLGRLGSRSSEPLMREMARGRQLWLRSFAENALELLGKAR